MPYRVNGFCLLITHHNDTIGVRDVIGKNRCLVCWNYRIQLVGAIGRTASDKINAVTGAGVSARQSLYNSRPTHPMMRSPLLKAINTRTDFVNLSSHIAPDYGRPLLDEDTNIFYLKLEYMPRLFDVESCCWVISQTRVVLIRRTHMTVERVDGNRSVLNHDLSRTRRW